MMQDCSSNGCCIYSTLYASHKLMAAPYQIAQNIRQCAELCSKLVLSSCMLCKGAGLGASSSWVQRSTRHVWHTRKQLLWRSHRVCSTAVAQPQGNKAPVWYWRGSVSVEKRLWYMLLGRMHLLHPLRSRSLGFSEFKRSPEGGSRGRQKALRIRQRWWEERERERFYKLWLANKANRLRQGLDDLAHFIK